MTPLTFEGRVLHMIRTLGPQTTADIVTEAARHGHVGQRDIPARILWMAQAGYIRFSVGRWIRA